MKNKALRFLLVLVIYSTIFPFLSFSLERDYIYSGAYMEYRYPEMDDDGDYRYYYYSDELCYSCFQEACFDDFPVAHQKELDVKVIPPTTNSDYYPYNTCNLCSNPNVYSGYLHFRYKGGYPFLKRQIQYTKKHPKIQAYWPETSYKAEQISEVAVVLFEDLIDSTALKRVTLERNLYDNFITDSWYFTQLRSTLPISLSACCFRFSDFYRVCNDLVDFSQIYFSEEDTALIVDKTDAILDTLYHLFLDVYQESLSLHPTEEIQSELNFMQLLYGIENSIDLHTDPTTKKKTINKRKYLNKPKENKIQNSHYSNLKIPANPELPDWLINDYWLQEGIKCNDLFLHLEAIDFLSAVIERDKSNIDAYMERLHAYFEIGQLSLAIEDYKTIKKLNSTKKSLLPNYLSLNLKNKDYLNTVENKTGSLFDYSRGFCAGISRGSSDSIVEFVPSTLSCCKGVLHCLWSFACSPAEVSNDLIIGSYDLVEFLIQSTPKECLEVIVPELKDLFLNWNSFSKYDKGDKIGYVIGKYGIDILAPGTILKGIKKYQQFKRINSLYTVECCALSEAKKATILEASSKHSTTRGILLESVKQGKVVPGNPNVIFHVMQEKHAWDKLVILTGDKPKDFKKVTLLLEEKGILSEKYLMESEKFCNGKIIRSDYKMTINGHEINAAFETYVESSQTFLKDAWVITR